MWHRYVNGWKYSIFSEAGSWRLAVDGWYGPRQFVIRLVRRGESEYTPTRRYAYREVKSLTVPSHEWQVGAIWIVDVVEAR